MTIFLHRRAAARGIDDKSVHAGVEKCVDVAPRHLFCRHRLAVMNVERAATGLARRENDVATVASKHPHSRSVYVAEQQRHNAAIEHRYSCAARADGSGNLSMRFEKL